VAATLFHKKADMLSGISESLGMLSGIHESLSGILCIASAISETDILKPCRQRRIDKTDFS